MPFQSRLASALGLAFALAVLVAALGVTSFRLGAVPAAELLSLPPPSAAPLREDAGLPRSASFQDHPVSVAMANAPTADKSQGKLWFAHGSWWALMVGEAASAVRLHRLDWGRQTWVDTGTVVDERTFSRADVLADGDDVYLVSAGASPFASHAARFVHLRYQARDDTYVLDPASPVTVTRAGVRSIVLTRDAAGVSWIAYLEEGRVYVVHSADGVTFSSAFAPPGTEAGASRVALIARKDDVALLWTEPDNSAVLLARHEQGADPGTWTRPVKLVEGLQSSDDHLNIKTATVGGEERLYLAVKTSLDESPTANPNSAQVLLVEVRPDDRVTRHLFGRVRDRHTRPIVLIDETAQLLYVIATAPSGGGRIYYKRSPLDRIAFAPGRGTPLVRSNEDLLINDGTSTKQNLDAASGLVVLGWSRDTSRYLHGVLDLGGEPWSEPSRLGMPSGADAGPDAGPGETLPPEGDAAPSPGSSAGTP